MSLNIITVDDIIACFKHLFKLGNSLKALKSLLLVGDNEIGLLHDVASVSYTHLTLPTTIRV